MKTEPRRCDTVQELFAGFDDIGFHWDAETQEWCDKNGEVQPVILSFNGEEIGRAANPYEVVEFAKACGLREEDDQ